MKTVGTKKTLQGNLKKRKLLYEADGVTEDIFGSDDGGRELARVDHLVSAPLVKDEEIEQYIQTLVNRCRREQFPLFRLENKRSLEIFIDELSNVFEFARGRLLIGNDTYEYLLEGWESECIAESVVKIRDWNNDEYLYGIVYDKHADLVKTDFLNRYKKVKIVIDDVREGSQFGISVVVAKIVEE